MIYFDINSPPEKSQIQIKSAVPGQSRQIQIQDGSVRRMLASPDGKKLLLLISKRQEKTGVFGQSQLAVLDMETDIVKLLEDKFVDFESEPVWFPNSDQFIYTDLDRRLHRYELSSSKDQLISQTQKLSNPLISADGLYIAATRKYALYESSSTELQSYRQELRQVVLFDSEGKEKILTPLQSESNTAVAWYPDGHLLLSRFKAGKQILVKVDTDNNLGEEFIHSSFYS